MDMDLNQEMKQLKQPLRGFPVCHAMLLHCAVAGVDVRIAGGPGLPLLSSVRGYSSSSINFINLSLKTENHQTRSIACLD